MYPEKRPAWSWCCSSQLSLMIVVIAWQEGCSLQRRLLAKNVLQLCKGLCHVHHECREVAVSVCRVDATRLCLYQCLAETEWSTMEQKCSKEHKLYRYSCCVATACTYPQNAYEQVCM